MKYTSNRKKLGMFLIISAKQQLGCYQLKNAAQEMSDFGIFSPPRKTPNTRKVNQVGIQCIQWFCSKFGCLVAR